MTTDKGRWPALFVLATAVLLSMTTWFSASAVVPQLREEWHLSSSGGALLTVAVQLGFVFGALGAAITNLADLVGPRRLILIGAATAAAANLGLVACDGLAGALPLRALTGASLALVYPPAMKAMATWFRRDRGIALGVLVGAICVGSATPHLLDAIGGVRWQIVIIGTSVLTLAGGLVAELAGKDGPYPFPKATFDPSQARLAWANRGVRLATLGYFGHMWELYAMWAWFAVFFAEVLQRHGSEDGRVGAAVATFVVIGLGAVGSTLGGVLGDRWGRTRLTSMSMALSGSCALLIGLLIDVHPAVVLAVGLFWGFWVIADSAQFSTIVTETADQRYVGTVLTLQTAAGFLLTAVSVYLLPVLTDSFSWRWVFALLAFGPALGVVAMLKLLRSPEAALIAEGRG
jgi:MFS family permease